MQPHLDGQEGLMLSALNKKMDLKKKRMEKKSALFFKGAQKNERHRLFFEVRLLGALDLI